MYVMHAPVSTIADFKTNGFALSVKNVYEESMRKYVK